MTAPATPSPRPIPHPNERSTMSAPTTFDLSTDWWILQDVHDVGEQVGLPEQTTSNVTLGNQVSEWEPLARLEHLQVALADNPFWGRELRYFNQAPWWYRRSFEASPRPGEVAVLRLSNVDQYGKVWLNGTLLGDHEGYSVPFEFDVTDHLVEGENTLVVKVWSPWDDVIRGKDASMRTFQVERRLTKGTYEHDDTLVARDVNPVGMYGTVELVTGPLFPDLHGVVLDPEIEGANGLLHVGAQLLGQADDEAEAQVIVREKGSGRVVARAADLLTADEAGSRLDADVRIPDVRRWETWDRGTPWLYEVEVILPGGGRARATTGFRDVVLERDAEHTSYRLNGTRLFVRGTSYFPDVYISQMYRERYARDLRAVREAGFNLVRVHVHVESPEFYALCDELGLAVMQDSEYNWTHPEDQDFADRLTAVYLETMQLLHNHPSLVTWICLNEPGVHDPDGGTTGFAMTKAPGPAMLEKVHAADPSRPLILGSYCEDDPHSGDSHNYEGSLNGPEHDYLVIDGTTEKFNTEFGIDAPGVEANLRAYPRLLDRLATDPGVVGRAQHYQYRLVKYYMEHYRLQRFAPCAGYVQFMFIDLCPQSWYGVLDYWGTPKPMWDALVESNQPVAVLLDQDQASSRAVVVINDTPRDLGGVQVDWSVRRGDEELASGRSACELGADSTVEVTELELSLQEHGHGLDVRLNVSSADGTQLARNRYDGLFDHPEHVAGHPLRMSHELGMRLFNA